MVNPFDITNYNRSKYQLEEFLLFCIVVAGKTAYIQSQKLEDFLSANNSNSDVLQPFNIIKELYRNDLLFTEIVRAKLGQYTKIYNAFKYLCNNPIDLNNCTIDELELIPGVGPKTSRFFVLHSRVSEVAVLDTHILKYLKQFDSNVPKTTPSNKKVYKKYELLFLEKCKLLNKNPAEFDLELWKLYAKRNKNEVCV